MAIRIYCDICGLEITSPVVCSFCKQHCCSTCTIDWYDNPFNLYQYDNPIAVCIDCDLDSEIVIDYCTELRNNFEIALEEVENKWQMSRKEVK